MDIQIKSDGTKKGTEVWVDGVKIENLEDLYFSVHSWDKDVSLSYETKEEMKDDNMVVTKYHRFDPSLASAKASTSPSIVETKEEPKAIDPKMYEQM